MDGMTERAMMEPDVMARSRIVRRYMLEHGEDYRDRTTGEVSATLLAEATARDFDLYIDGDGTITETMFEVASQVANTLN